MYHAKYTPNKSLYKSLHMQYKCACHLCLQVLIHNYITYTDVYRLLGVFFVFIFFSSFFFIMFSVSYDPDISFIYVNIRFGLKGALQTLNLRFLQY